MNQVCVQLDIAAAGKRLGLTQQQMAHALNITTRTPQNWEKKVGTSQLLRKTRDLRELLSLMHDYVVPTEEQDWLNTSLAALHNRKPSDVVAQGQLRDIIDDFPPLPEPQPPTTRH